MLIYIFISNLNPELPRRHQRVINSNKESFGILLSKTKSKFNQHTHTHTPHHTTPHHTPHTHTHIPANFIIWNDFMWNWVMIIGIDTEIEVRVASPMTRQSYHISRRSRWVWRDWRVTGDATDRKLWYQFLFNLDAAKHTKFILIRVWKNSKLLWISHYIESMAVNHRHTSHLINALVGIVTS